MAPSNHTGGRWLGDEAKQNSLEYNRAKETAPSPIPFENHQSTGNSNSALTAVQSHNAAQ